MILPKHLMAMTTAILSAVLLGACADWNTTPDALDARLGFAVQDMIDNQTLYPEHGDEEKQVLIMDGRKAEGVIQTYREPPKKDVLIRSKEPLEFDMGGSSR